MQCQGKTRNGQRCRNRSLDNELFCDIHMRVNHSYNLALLLPLLLSILAVYFFFFGLFFNTAIFGVFDINYLKYAGLEDLFLDMLRFGGVVTLILLVVWICYAILLFLFCGLALIFRMVKSTGQSKLGFFDRLKIIGLSLMVFMFNILLLLVVLFPKRNRRKPSTISIKREKFARTLQDLRTRPGGLIEGRPFLNAQDIFQEYLYLKSAGNHRFFMSILLLFIVSVGVTYYAGGKAEYARACTLMQNPSSDTGNQVSLPFPAFILAENCQITAPKSVQQQGLTSTFIGAITGFFNFTPVLVQASQKQVFLLHLATTSRFDLFFNGQDGRSLVLPRGTLTFLDDEQDNSSYSSAISTLVNQFSKLEKKLFASNRTLFGLGKDLQKTNEELTRLNQNDTAQPPLNPSQTTDENTVFAVRTVPASCWQKEPIQMVTFSKGSHVITDATALDSLIQLSLAYRRKPDISLVIFGYADPDGAAAMNQRLSQRRANHVTHLLEKLGINRLRLIPRGLGEDDNSQNQQRRVEIRVCDLRKISDRFSLKYKG